MLQRQEFFPQKHGFFDDMVTMLASLSSYLFAMHVSIASNSPTPPAQRPISELISYIAPIKSIDFPMPLRQNGSDEAIIVFPARLLSPLSLGIWPPYFEFQVVPKDNPQARIGLAIQGNQQMVIRIVGASFINYYTKSEPEIKTRYGSDVDKWPETVRFALVIRNGFVHDGKINISDPASRPAVWKIWSFDYHQDGKEFLLEAGMLDIGDVIVLMQDVDSYIRP